MVLKAEGGLKSHRTEWVQESSNGVPPADPAWALFSDTVRSFEWSADGAIEVTRGIGDANPSAFLKGPETHEVTVTYDLQQKTGTGDTFLTSGGATNDALTDAIQRDTDNAMNATHTVVDREEKNSIQASETVGGSNSLNTRIYTVALGCQVDEATISGDPGSQNPVLVELSYQAEKVRTYQFDQPSTSETLDVVSDNANDTTQTVTIEQEDGTSDSVSLNGTTTQTTTTSYADIDVIEVTDGSGNRVDAEGTITVSNSTDGDLAKIYGSAAYDNMEGDSGVPALGTGSHGSAYGQDFELIVGDTVERPGGTSLAFDISSVEMTVSNNIETTSRVDTVKPRLHAGVRDTELSATVLGETQSHSDILEHLQTTENNIVWTFDSGEDLTLSNAVLNDVGSRTIEAGDAAMTMDNTFMGKDLTINS